MCHIHVLLLHQPAVPGLAASKVCTLAYLNPVFLVPQRLAGTGVGMEEGGGSGGTGQHVVGRLICGC